MKRTICLMFLLPSVVFAQDFKFIKATKQTINSGASPTSTNNYTIEISKSKKCKWSIDSVVNLYTSKAVEFQLFKIENATVLSPSNKPIEMTSIKQNGSFQIKFSSMKNRGSGRPGAPPMNLMVPVADFTQGAIVYYRIGKKKMQLKVESFDELETINAP